MKMKIKLYKEELTVCKVHTKAQMELVVTRCLAKVKFFSITKTPDEISIILPSEEISDLPDIIEKSQDRWRMMRIEGVLDFDMVGVLASIAQPLKDANIPILALGTFNTDYILVSQDHVTEAIQVLNQTTQFVVIETTESLK